MSPSLIPVLTPHGALRLEAREDEAPLDDAVAARLGAYFSRGDGHGLLHLGLAEVGTDLPPGLAFWRGFAMRFMRMLCLSLEAASEPLSAGVLSELVDAAPPMAGGEYLTVQILAAAWGRMAEALRVELAERGVSLRDFMGSADRRWRLVGRVHLNLAENRRDPDCPFAFMATYAASLGEQGGLRHAPLAQALRDHADDKRKLLELLEPVSHAAERLDWLKEIVDAGEIFHPLRWTPKDAMRFLESVETMEASGLIVRMPASWRMNRPSRPEVEATIGSNEPSRVGTQQMLDFDMRVTLDGEPLTQEEIESLLESTAGLALLRGKWVEIDRERLTATLERFEAVERLADQEGLNFAQAMRLVAGADIGAKAAPADAKWGHIDAGPWLAETLRACRDPQAAGEADPGAALKADLRPYQKAGVQWLALLTRLELGACLADDMGLGKTIQLLALLLTAKQRAPEGGPSLLVAPASLLANWASEAARFAPSLRVVVCHPAFMAPAELKAVAPDSFSAADLVVTSYATLLRIGAFVETKWRFVVLDEAQAIKNPNAKQTRAVKSLRGQARIALTGTPIENNLRDLWSIFDFINPGLLGTSKAFADFVKRLAAAEPPSYAPLKRLAAPYILRRLKTDKSVIADLPDKTEVPAFCALSKKQAALYEVAVDELEQRLKQADDDIARRGLVLSMLMRLKQICNHPSQWLSDGAYEPAQSGKFARLAEIAETVASRQEKLLVFTQFKEIIPPLERLLASVFGRSGLVLHGDTPVAKRKDLVKKFQEDETIPFFVLSLKAGGSGLTLTAASHVAHFDRWWNPSVENQATDRAFRIGQKRNVLVHKFVCRGTIEERIDQLIESKRQLAQDVLGGGQEIDLAGMNDRDLMALVRLDLDAAMKEA
ncbi:DEAD/DEAH box helicase [Methylosinus sp. Sm6]|uniref:DEAD/DEAH box helicase n=1 Tax=Methylosinus sp. Sm6 TaxID=2866948 RepID=UPI001C9A08AC|nr:DEAD/DEAH box helicase [Methylosinus sp. Sm6]MBY6241548.1 DEAD/DEAH box helicase [Methylosinus sp. Sm6]